MHTITSTKPDMPQRGKAPVFLMPPVAALPDPMLGRLCARLRAATGVDPERLTLLGAPGLPGIELPAGLAVFPIGDLRAALAPLSGDTPVVLVAAAGPLCCPQVVDAALAVVASGRARIATSDLGSGVLPRGLDVVAGTAEALRAAPAPLAMPSWRGRYELSSDDLGLPRLGRRFATFDLMLPMNTEDRRREALLALCADLDVDPEPLGLWPLLRRLDSAQQRGAPYVDAPGQLLRAGLSARPALW